MKIVICVPVHRSTEADFTASLFNMQRAVLSTMLVVDGQNVRPDMQLAMFRGSSRLDHAREMLAEGALASGADFIFWLDADHTFPATTLFDLMKRNLPFVGCNYPRKYAGGGSTASNIVDGKAVLIEPRPDGVEAVDLIGFGVALMRREVLAKLARPWFQPSRYGEDGYFCLKAKRAGFQPHVDHALSSKIGHIGDVVHML